MVIARLALPKMGHAVRFALNEGVTLVKKLPPVGFVFDRKKHTMEIHSSDNSSCAPRILLS